MTAAAEVRRRRRRKKNKHITNALTITGTVKLGLAYNSHILVVEDMYDIA